MQQMFVIIPIVGGLLFLKQEIVWEYFLHIVYFIIYVFSFFEIKIQKCITYFKKSNKQKDHDEVTYTIVCNGNEELTNYTDIIKNRKKYDFCIVTKQQTDVKNHKLVVDVLDELLPYYIYPTHQFQITSYIWIIMNVTINNKEEYKINLCNDDYSYYLVGNKINRKVILYLLQKYHSILIHDTPDVIVKLEMMDHNAQFQIIWFPFYKSNIYIELLKDNYKIVENKI